MYVSWYNFGCWSVIKLKYYIAYIYFQFILNVKIYIVYIFDIFIYLFIFRILLD